MKYLQHTSLVGPFPSVGQRRQNRTSTAISRQQGDPFDRCTMLPPHGKVTIREGRPRERETRRSPRRQDAARPLGGSFKYTEMGLRFRASKARKPLPPLGGYVRNPFTHERVPCGCLFWYFSRQRTRKVHPKPNNLATTSFRVFQTPPHQLLTKSPHCGRIYLRHN